MVRPFEFRLQKTVVQEFRFLCPPHILDFMTPMRQKTLSHGIVLRPSLSPPSEAWREDHYCLMTSKTGLQIENNVVDLQISKWKIPPENGMKILLSF